jgi:metal-responsive CopG/Arc/MetJ family transcriptional regulator
MSVQRSIELPDHLVEWLDEYLQAHPEESLSGLVREALEMKSKQEMLRREISVGVEQVKQGAYTEYDDASLSTLLEKIKTNGREKLAQDDRA